MKEIKFRVLHKPSEVMLYQLTQSPCFGKFEGDNAVSIEDVFFYEPQDFEVMQYTGLKDKNGVEIYEGDILKITCNFELRKGIETDKVVWWEAGATYCCSDWTLFELIQNHADNEQEYEVISNIYANPELLEGDTHA